jgi:hypothetical protein
MLKKKPAKEKLVSKLPILPTEVGRLLSNLNNEHIEQICRLFFQELLNLSANDLQLTFEPLALFNSYIYSTGSSIMGMSEIGELGRKLLEVGQLDAVTGVRWNTLRTSIKPRLYEVCSISASPNNFVAGLQLKRYIDDYQEAYDEKLGCLVLAVAQYLRSFSVSIVEEILKQPANQEVILEHLLKQLTTTIEQLQTRKVLN